MTKGLVVSLLFALFTSVSATPKRVRLCEGFLPPNNKAYPISPVASGLSEAEYNEVLDRVQAVYGPIFQQKGGTLKIERKWSNPKVNAYADRSGNYWLLGMYGGMARHPKMNKDAFLTVACHEIGHQIGGAPIYRGDWASLEGQSDYHAMLKCLRIMFEKDDNKKILEGMTLDPIAVASCEAQHSSQQDQLICIRSVQAALPLGALLGEDDNIVPALDTPDKTEVTKTLGDHPAAQCRVDTMLEAALCKVPFAQDVDDSDYKIGSCFTPNDARGSRPRCWFKPN